MSRIQEIQRSLEGLADSPQKVALIIELAEIYQNSEPAKALAQAEAAIELSQRLGYPQGLGQATRLAGAIHEQLSEYPQAISCGIKALSIYRELGDRREEARCLNNIGLAYVRMGALRVALDFFVQALGRLSAEDDTIRAYVVNNIGLTHISLDNHEKALEYFQQSLEVLERMGDVRNVARGLSNIGLCYRHMGKLDEALEVMKRSLAIRQSIGDRFSQAHNWINLSNIYRDRRDYEQSQQCLMRAMDLAVEGGHSLMEVYVMALMAKLKNVTGDLDSAREYIEQGLPLAEKIGDQAVLRNLYQEYADNLEARGEMEQSHRFRMQYFRSLMDLVRSNVAEAEKNRSALAVYVPQDIWERLFADQIEDLERKAQKLAQELQSYWSQTPEGRPAGDIFGPVDRDSGSEAEPRPTPQGLSAEWKQVKKEMEALLRGIQRLKG